VSTAKLFLSGIRAEGRHGARPGEKDEPQPFVVDLDIDVTVSGDDLVATADYRAITETVRSVVQERSFDLIEVLARAVAAAVLSLDNVTRVTAVVHKPSAAGRLDIDGVAAAATVGRD
jgi:dihydroneopterin aldolase